MEANTQITALKAVVPSLRPHDANFAESLISQFERFGRLSPKQWPYVEKLVATAKQGETPRETVEVGSLDGILKLFEKASQHLKHPSVILSVPGSEAIEISVAGAQAKVPGSLNVTTKERRGDEGRKNWFGRILRDGKFEKSPRQVSPAALVASLQAFAKEPAKVAAEYGKLHGYCCFCNRKLKDERSTEVGYGETCANHFGLPYPKMSEVKVKRAA